MVVVVAVMVVVVAVVVAVVVVVVAVTVLLVLFIVIVNMVVAVVAVVVIFVLVGYVAVQGRVLELLVLLDEHWQKHRLGSYKLVLLHNTAFNTAEFAKSQVGDLNSCFLSIFADI